MSIGEPGQIEVEQSGNTKFFAGAFSEVKKLPPPVGSMQGKFYEVFTNTLRTADERLQQLNLPRGILKPQADMTRAEFQIYTGLNPEAKEQVDTLRTERNATIESIIRQDVVPTASGQTLPQGILEAPDNYHKQESARTCGVANFRTIFEAVTDQPVKESDIVVAAREQGTLAEGQRSAEAIEVETLLGIFQTQTFKEQFPGRTVGILPIRGTDFEDIIGAVNRMKEKRPNLKAYCLVSVASEVVNDGWHSVILLSADENTVTIHDPSPSVGKAFKTVPKEDFLARWSKTFLAGNIVIQI